MLPNENELASEPSTFTTPRAPESGTRLIVPMQAEDDEDVVRADLSVEVDHESDSCFFAPLSGEVADGGIFVATWRALEVGAELTLEIELPDGVARARGIVLFRRDASEGTSPGVGIALEILDDSGLARVRAFCEAREPLYYDV